MALRWRARLPLATSAATGFAVMAVGDGAVQVGLDGAIDAQRVAVSSTYNGLVYAPVMHVWWGKLDAWWPGRTAGAVVRKVLVNQIVITPFNSLCFISWSKLIGAAATGARGGERVDWLAVRAQTEAHLRAELPTLLATSCAFWPFAHACNFAFAPISLRIFFMSTCSVGWGGYLSYVSHRLSPSSS
ncbi:hypothetical protein KFE25_005567 [Diacronema lutheri]|uniref:Peroxisomal membrane protein MPV17 n=1 Tax=Diacronema lutheri TaxID=2081491 RepID=A0A8J6C909_DIALT|nr:hypothetical protein KFE25_005567 [Diacronema lutheri]